MTQLSMNDYDKIGYLITQYFWYDGHQAAFGLHEDKPHLHIHIAVNSVNYRTGKKYHLQYRDYKQIRQYIQKVVDPYLVRILQ